MALRAGQDDRKFQDLVRTALTRIASGALDKVVLARPHEVTLSRPIDWALLLQRLRDIQPHSTTYALALPDESGPAALVGASPELLVSLQAGRVRCLPLAGSRRRSADPLEDELQRNALLTCRKDLHEHRLLVEQLVKDLSKYVTDLALPQGPIAHAAGPMWHLASPIEARLKDRSVNVLDLVLALYPTAAVCGVPRAGALELLEQEEPFDRGLYGGALGYMNPAGDGEWIVTIRGAEIHRDRARLFAGAGIVSGSNPALEAQETRDKLRSALTALEPFL